MMLEPINLNEAVCVATEALNDRHRDDVESECNAFAHTVCAYIKEREADIVRAARPPDDTNLYADNQRGIDDCT
jgi:hypothetical protein